MMSPTELSKWIRARYGDVVDLGPVIVGRNLNLLSVRGFARLDTLAVISAPDVFDMVRNPTGTQRELKQKHAKECFVYATESLDCVPDDEPRAFPEVILNARDGDVVEIYNLANPDEIYDFNSFDLDEEREFGIAGLRINLRNIGFPKPEKAPKISRVDGNHRLHGADEEIERESLGDDNPDEVSENLEFPQVPYCMLLGLTAIQEGALFKDINDEHEGMETAHLDSLTLRLKSSEELKKDPKFLPLWVAAELTKPGRAFHGIVFMGGSMKGVRASDDIRPLLKINALKSAIQVQLRHAKVVSADLTAEPEVIVNILDNYWAAVRDKFPDAWNNKRDYILLQSIGLNGFAEFGGDALDKAYNEGSVDKEDFERILAPIAISLTLERTAEIWNAVAGAGGARKVATELLKAANPDAVKRERVVSKYRTRRTIDEKLGIASD
jgi:DGQHR domain-containing protein